MSGLSTTLSISLGLALVAGRKRVPRPATGKTALVTALVLNGITIPIYVINLLFISTALIVQQASHSSVQTLQGVVFPGQQPLLGLEPQSFHYQAYCVL